MVGNGGIVNFICCIVELFMLMDGGNGGIVNSICCIVDLFTFMGGDGEINS